MTIDQSLASLSDGFFSATVAVYSLALVAFCADLAFGRAAPSIAPRAVEVGTALTTEASQATVAGPVQRRHPWGAVAMALTVAGVVAHATSLVTRGIATGHLPWGNMYELSTAVLLVAVLAYVVVALQSPALRAIGAFVLGPIVLALVLVGLFLYAEAGPLVAALRSYWLAIHVTTVSLSFGIFFVSGVTSALYVARSRTTQVPSDGGVLARLPSAVTLDRVAHRTAVFGFPLWTFAVIAGAIWAESAWGRFWGWDPKETWSFVAWVLYAAYLHARTTAGWRGRPAAWVNVLGLAVMVFNLLFVNLVSTGLHSYAGV